MFRRDVLKSPLLNDAAATLAFRLVSVGVGVLNSLILARLLSVTEMGEYSLFALFVAVMGALFGSGYAGVAYAVSNQSVQPSIALWSSLPLMSVGALCSVAAAIYIRSAEQISVSLAVAAVAGAGVGALIVQAHFQGLYLGLSQATKHNVAQYAPQHIFLALLTIAALAGRLSLDTAVAAWATAHLVNATRLTLLSRTPASAAKATFSTAVAAIIVRFNFQLAMGTLLLIASSRANLVTLNSLSGLEVVAFYSVSLLIAETIYHVPMSIVVASYRTVGGGSRTASIQLTARLVRNCFWGLALLALAVTAAAPLIPVVLGSAYNPVTALLRIILVGIPFYGCKDLFAAFFMNQEGRPLSVTGSYALGAGVNIVTGVVLIPHIGLIGAGWAYVLGAVVCFVFLASAFLKSSRLTLRELLVPRKEDVRVIRQLRPDAHMGHA